MLSCINICMPIPSPFGILASTLKNAVLTLPTLHEKEDWYSERSDKLYSQHKTSIYRMAYSYLNNREDAEDIVQDTIIQYLKVKPFLRNEDHEKAWLLKVAANLSLNRLKYNKIRETTELSDTLIQEGRPDLSYIWDAVRKLPSYQRAAIHLHYQEGYSTKEIAYIVKRKSSTVRSDLNRGREALRHILREEYGIEEGI